MVFNSHRNRTILLALACLAAGCESVPPETQAAIETRLAEANVAVAPSGVLSVVDARPKEDRTDRMYSLLVGACDYGVRRFGDGALFPDRIVRLDQALAKEFGSTLGPDPIRVVRYDIHLNGAVEYTAGAAAATAGALGGVPGSSAGGQAPACPREKMKVGWFDRADLTNGNTPMIVDIEIAVGTKTFRANAAASPAGSPFNGAILRALTPAGKAAAFDAMNKAHARLVAEIKASRAGS